MNKLINDPILKVIIYFILLFLTFSILTLLNALLINNREVFNNFEIFSMILAFTITILVIMRIENFRFEKFKKINYKTIILLILISTLFVVCYPIYYSNFYISLSENLFVITKFNFKSIHSFYLIHTVLLTPVLEEVLYRKIFISILKKKYNLFYSVLISSTLFSLFHMNIEQFLSAIIFGILLGAIYYKTENIIICILIHMITNFLIYFSEDSFVQNSILMWVALLITISFIYLFYRLIIHYNIKKYG